MQIEHQTGAKFNVFTVMVTVWDPRGQPGPTWHGFLFFCRYKDQYKLCYMSSTPSGAFRFETGVRSSISGLQKDLNCEIVITSEVSKRLWMDHWQEVEQILQRSLAKVDWRIGDMAEHWAAQAFGDVLELYPGHRPVVWLREAFARDPVSRYIVTGEVPTMMNDENLDEERRTSQD